MSALKLNAGLLRVETLDVETLRREANQAGYRTFVLPEGVNDRASFFDAVRSTLPLDPPVVSSHSWDALSDSLWEGLFALEDQRIAILWPGTHTMAHTAAPDLEMALNVLRDVTGSLADPTATSNRPKVVAVVVHGDG